MFVNCFELKAPARRALSKEVGVYFFDAATYIVSFGFSSDQVRSSVQLIAVTFRIGFDKVSVGFVRNFRLYEVTL